jgi:predicted alpha/beta-fold hydrolase
MTAMERAFARFEPPRLLRNPHVQTLLASVGRKPEVTRRAATLLACSRAQRIVCTDGVILEAWVSEPGESDLLWERPPGRDSAPPIATRRLLPQDRTPTVVIIHGWLGSAASSYVLSAAAELLAAGFRVARLNLRDHGDTAHLNEGLFHSARTQEVVDAVRELAGDRGGVLGFSLGGNFALRVARALGTPALAICPAIEPANTMRAIDGGWRAYRWYFLRKWRRALAAKQRAFPERYDFASARGFNTVTALTDLFVRDHTEFADSAAYLAGYTLTGDALEGTSATIVTAEDDPIIPWRDFGRLPETIEIVAAPWGGHCGFVEGTRAPSWVDRYAVRFFGERLR